MVAAERRQLARGLTDEGYRLLVERSPDGIYVYADGRAVFVNDTAVRLMLAESRDELIGRPVTDFVVSESLPALSSGIAELRWPGDCTGQRFAQMIRMDGSLLAVEVVIVKTEWNDEPAYEVITRDVSARHDAEAGLRHQAALVDHVSDAIIGTTSAGVITSWNPAAESIYGRSVVEALGRSISEVVGATVDPVAIVASGGVVHSSHRNVDGAALTVRVSAAVMADGYVFVCCDLTALHRAEQHFEAVVDSMAEGVIVIGKDGRIKSINPAAVQIMGTGPEVLGGDFFGLTGQFPFYDHEGVNIPPDLRPALATLREGKPFYNQVFGFDRLGAERIWLMSSCRLVNPDMPGQSDMLMSFTNVTAERAAADKVMFYATHDALTKLPNRASVLRKINRALAAREEHGKLRAVLFIDIDDLKATNDTLGHTAGDEVLRSAAQCLQRVMADGDVAGRLGGDEFVVLVCRAVSRRELNEMVERLRSELRRPTASGPSSPPIHASVGVVEVHSTEQRTADEILRDADLAMYETKRANRNQQH